MLELNRIYEALLNRKEKVCHKSEIVGLIREYKERFKSKINIRNSIKYLSRHHRIKRVFKGYYYINSIDEYKRNYCYYEDKELLFIVLNKLNVNWYLGLSSAEFTAGEIWQPPARMHIVNNKFSGEKIILGTKVVFYKIKEQLIFAVKEKKTVRNTVFFYSDSDKTKLDMLYFKKIKKVRPTEQMKKFIKYYPKWFGKKLI